MTQFSEGQLVRRFAQLLVGLVGFGFSMALLIRSTLGAMPWDVLNQGLVRHIGLTMGSWSIIVSLLVLLAWWPLRQPPGIGTVCNVFIVGVSVDLGLAVLPTPASVAGQVVYMLGGIVLNGVSTAANIGVRLGPGPRDGLMTGLTLRTRLPLRAVRTMIEGTVVLTGWLSGGTLGVGTLLYVASIGPIVHGCLPLFTVIPPEGAADQRTSQR